ncbi:MAG: DUF6384 family protein [archaeon]
MAKNNLPGESVDLNTALKIRKIEEELRGVEGDVEAQFNINVLKDKYTDVLRAADIAGGKTPDEEKIAAATEIYFSRLNTFQGPKRTFSVKLAEAYVERKRLGMKYGIPTVLAMSAAAAIWAGSVMFKSAHQAALESRVENRVENVFKQSHVIEGELAAEDKKALAHPELPESEKVKLQENVKVADSQLAEVNTFLKEVCPNGSARKEVTRENFNAVENRIAGYESKLGIAQEKLKGAKEIVQTQEELTSTKRTLDSLLAEVKSIKPAESFQKSAESFYHGGMACVANRQLNEARKYQSELRGVKGQVGEFESLRVKVGPVYNDIRAIAKEDLSRLEAEQMFVDANQAIASANVLKLKQAVTDLEGVDRNLNLEFTDYVMDCDRRMPDNSNIQVIRFYAVLERKGKDGRTIPVTITHEENKSRVTVNKRGYRVGEVALARGQTPNDIRHAGKEPEIYTRLLHDIEDNGVIDNAVFAVKERGYKDARIKMKGVPPCGGEYPY